MNVGGRNGVESVDWLVVWSVRESVLFFLCDGDLGEVERWGLLYDFTLYALL